MESLGQIVVAACSLITLLTSAGLALLRSSLTNLREQNKDLRDEIGDLTRRHDGDQKTINAQRSELQVLRPMVTGEAHWQGISDAQDEHHREAKATWTQQNEQLTEILEILRRQQG